MEAWFGFFGTFIFGFILGYMCGKPDDPEIYLTEDLEEPEESESEEEFNNRIMQQ